MTGMPIKMSYSFKDVAIPDDFLKTDPPDAEPITFKQIDFRNSVLKEFAGCYAVVLDHVLSPSECAQLLELAEASVSDGNRNKVTGSPWARALVNAGGGYEVEVPDYRNSDRIIWDQQEIMKRLWARLVQVPQISETLLQAPGGWEFNRVNERMRFLKYGPGEFFRPHCDSAYSEVSDDGHAYMSHYTLHLYLNDSKQEVGDEAQLVGGATSFLSSNEQRKMDVDPKAGRVLIFQHRRLYHSGDDVREGIKYTMRTDIMYRQPGAQFFS